MSNRINFILAATLLLAVPAWGHHSGAPYDSDSSIEVSGVVEEWSWQNSHAWLRLQVTNSKGENEEWNIEATSPNILLRQGWRRSTLAAGDEVTVLIRPMRDGTPGGSLMGARLSDGTELGAPPGSGGSGSLTGTRE